MNIGIFDVDSHPKNHDDSYTMQWGLTIRGFLFLNAWINLLTVLKKLDYVMILTYRSIPLVAVVFTISLQMSCSIFLVKNMKYSPLILEKP